MIAGHGTPDQAPARLFAYRHPQAMAKLLTTLADYAGDYLIRQIDHGADVVQIFEFPGRVCSTRPALRLVASLRCGGSWTR